MTRLGRRRQKFRPLLAKGVYPPCPLIIIITIIILHYPWWREGPLVGTSGLRLQTQVLKVVDALRCQCDVEMIISKVFKNSRKKEIQSKSFLTGASTSSIGLKSSRGVLLSKSESRHCVKTGVVKVMNTLLRRYNVVRNDLLLTCSVT